MLKIVLHWQEFIKETIQDNTLGVLLEQFDTVVAAITWLSVSENFARINLAIVDGNLPDGSGNQVLEYLANNSFTGETIFLSSDKPKQPCSKFVDKGKFDNREFVALVRFL